MQKFTPHHSTARYRQLPAGQVREILGDRTDTAAIAIRRGLQDFPDHQVVNCRVDQLYPDGEPQAAVSEQQPEPSAPPELAALPAPAESGEPESPVTSVE